MTSLFVLLSLPGSLVALDEERLWLPVSHEKLYLHLKKAALNAEQLDRCKQVLRGTVDFEQGTEDKPIFRILCRQPNGKTYNEMVDGLSGEPMTTLAINSLNPSSVDLSALTEDERLTHREKRVSNAIDNKKKAFWNECMKRSQEKIQLFTSVTVVERANTLISFSHKDVSDRFVVNGAKAVYRRDFDAKDMKGRHLAYKIVCIVSSGEKGSPLDITVQVKKRRD